MTKNKNDKTKISSWEDNDVFALKINTEEYKEYNGKYIIFIYTDIRKEKWKTTRTTCFFRAKITKSKILPKTKEEIDKLEYIKTSTYGYLYEKNRHEEDVKDLKPDEYNLLNTYVLEICAYKYKIPENLIYLGNFNIKKPGNEYIPFSMHHMILYSFWVEKNSNVIDQLLMSYKLFNLKESGLYSKEGRKEYIERQKCEIEIMQRLDKLQKLVDGPNGKEILKSMGINDNEKRTNNSLTYVGNEPEKKQK